VDRHIATHLVVLVVIGTTLFKKTLKLHHFKPNWDEIWHECSFQVNAHRVTESEFNMTTYFQDAGHDVNWQAAGGRCWTMHTPAARWRAVYSS